MTDTVGFIRDLPHEIVKAFKSTLEEAVFADLILVVADISDAQCKEKIDVTQKTLEEIGATAKQIVVYNKCDLTDEFVEQNQDSDCVFISAKTGFGIDVLKNRIENIFSQSLVEYELFIPYAEFSLLSRINKDEMLKFENTDDGSFVTIRVDKSNKNIKIFEKFAK